MSGLAKPTPLEPHPRSEASRDARLELPPRGTIDLAHAYHCAKDAEADLWDFAMELDQLYDKGLSITDLRWMVAKGLVEHGKEVSVYGNDHRSFERTSGFKFTAESAFVLTELGAQFASRHLVQEEHPWTPAQFAHETSTDTEEQSATALSPKLEVVSDGKELNPVPATPLWDSARRELRIGSQLIKRYRVPARNQEWILDVFQEDGWPDQIDDPLPRSPDIDPKTRLHDAINRLNGKQVNTLIRFRGNGSGKAISWERVSPSHLGSI